MFVVLLDCLEFGGEAVVEAVHGVQFGDESLELVVALDMLELGEVEGLQEGVGVSIVFRTA